MEAISKASQSLHMDAGLVPMFLSEFPWPLFVRPLAPSKVDLAAQCFR